LRYFPASDSGISVASLNPPSGVLSIPSLSSSGRISCCARVLDRSSSYFWAWNLSRLLTCSFVGSSAGRSFSASSADCQDCDLPLFCV
jgi:hypothetical protein